jgi:hypothetical protein
MKLDLAIDWKEIKGIKAVEFGVRDNRQTLGTLRIGKGGLRWLGKKGHPYPIKPWGDVIDWLKG